MRKIGFPQRTCIFLCACLFISATKFASVASPINPGSICKKIGSTQIYKGSKYICVKSGKKLLWKKVITTKSPTPSPSITTSPAPKPSASPSPIPTPSPSPSVSPSLSPTPSPSPSPTPSIQYPEEPTSFGNLIQRYEGISYAAWRKSQTIMRTSTAVAPQYKSLIGKNTTLAFKNPASAFDLVARLYSGYTSSKDFTVLFFNFEDRFWAQEQMKLLQPNHDSRWITNTACATRETCWGGGVFSDNEGRVLIVLTTEILDKNHTSGTLEAHEYAHAIQQSQMRRPSPWPPVGDWPPTWFIEGQALFAQNASVFFESFDLYKTNRRETSEELYIDSSIDSTWIQNYFVVNPPSTWFNKYKSWRQYDLGSMFVEILTALQGPDSTMEVWVLMGNGATFVDAFQKVYKIPFDEALPIIAKAIALQLGRN